MLQDNTKYRLVPWKWTNTGYTDYIILDYLENLPINERPTLLTADQNLALKAKCLGFEYILFLSTNSSRSLKKRRKRNDLYVYELTLKEEPRKVPLNLL